MKEDNEELLDRVYHELQSESFINLAIGFCILRKLDPNVMDQNAHYTVEDLLQEEIIKYLEAHPDQEHVVKLAINTIKG